MRRPAKQGAVAKWSSPGLKIVVGRGRADKFCIRVPHTGDVQEPRASAQGPGTKYL